MYRHQLHDLVPVAFVVQFLLSLAMYFGGRGSRTVTASGAEVFRINPVTAWLVTVMSFGVAGILAYGIWSSRPSPTEAPLFLFLGEFLFFFLGLTTAYTLQTCGFATSIS